jgi:hypothetical protein
VRHFLLVAFAGLFIACGPPVLRGQADLSLRSILDTRAATSQAIAPLLTADVEVHREGETVRGVEAGAAALAQVKPDGATRLERHHGVSALKLGDGRVLVLQRNEQDRIMRAVEFRAPSPGDGVPRKMFFYGAAWNTDPAKARRDLIQFTYAEDGFYVDPGHEVIGVDAVSRMIGNLRMVAPGSVIQYTSGIADIGGGWMTEDWTMLSRPGGRTLFNGYDFIHVNAEGKIDFLAGFIGKRADR